MQCISRKKGVVCEIKGRVKPTPTMLRSCVDGGLYEGGQEKKEKEEKSLPTSMRSQVGCHLKRKRRVSCSLRFELFAEGLCTE